VWSVLLDGSQGKIASRLKIREDHFLPTLLLRSQIALLEPEHSGLTLNIEQSPSDLVHINCTGFGAKSAPVHPILGLSTGFNQL
jgi:gluconate kinase